MSRAARKLDEAGFFLGFLEKKPRIKPPEFNYYLSAFVSAARSVFWVMRAERSDVPGWAEWFEGKEAAPEDQKLMEAFNSARIRSQKREPLQTRASLELVIPGLTPELEAALRSASFRGLPVRLVPATDGPPSGVTILATATVVAVRQHLSEIPDVDIVQSCRQYFDFLKAVVEECDNRFDRGPSSD